MAEENLNQGTTEPTQATTMEAAFAQSKQTDTQTAEPTVANVEADSNVTEQTTPVADNSSTPTFTDPNSIPEELMPIYKNMQAGFTKAMQGNADLKRKAEMVDAFEQNPQATIRQLAAQYGVDLNQAQQQAVQTAPEADPNWQPNQWEEVIGRAETRAVDKIMQELGPTLNSTMNELKSLKKERTERILDDRIPEWRNYETEMIRNLEQHPTLANDPVKLAELSMPDEVKKGRAYKKAMDELSKKSNSSKVATTQSVKAESSQTKANTMNEAYIQAKRMLGQPIN